ncbi:helix-turn-helix domain-containing protein [Segatella baroniae]|uniref:helix-turn-helix domain-containing protein n=1 Tax=Segatella baroniae TaxID=305719 RepID=UPI0009DB9DB3|nr:helix-turn-helix domain-containing protein [Segatella baroniae]
MTWISFFSSMLGVEREEFPQKECVTAEAQAEKKPVKLQPEKIVIVADESHYTSSCLVQLAEEYPVIVCEDGQKAMLQILEHKPALVIANSQLPTMNGIQLCTCIRNNFNVNDIPVIILSDHPSDQERLDSLASGASDYFSMSVSLIMLRTRIHSLISQYNTVIKKYAVREIEGKAIQEINLQTHDEKLMENILVVISNNMSNPELTVETLSEGVGISRGHLYRKVREMTNDTPHALVRKIRLQQAARLLAEHHYNVSRVMRVCGFRNASSFARMFKQTYGKSPTDFMNQSY